MKEYTVWFIIKKEGHGWVKKFTTQAKNQKEAKEKALEYSLSKLDRYAFYRTCHAPVETDSGLHWHGAGVFTRYCDWMQRVW